MNRTLRESVLNFLFNAAFGAYHIIFGIMTASWWMFTVGIYYAMLGIIRFAVLLTKKRFEIVTRFT